MNLKAFENNSGIMVNVDLDLVDMVSEMPDGGALLQFGGQSVALAAPYSEVAPQVTAARVVRSPRPVPPAIPPSGDSEPPPAGEDAPPHTDEPPALDNANNGGGETDAESSKNP